MSERLLTLDQLTKRYGDKTALQNVSFGVDQGEFVALVGMSGGGKSTILRLVAHLEQPTSGTVTFRDPNTVIRVMFQNDRLLPWMTNAENVSFHSADKTTQQRALTMLAEVGLAADAKSHPNELSGGQKQRLALARALMAEPQLLLLDEPLGALDALTRRKMQELIASICQKQRLTTLLITHDVEEAARMADRIIVISNGQNVYETPGAKNGDPSDVTEVSERVLNVILKPSPD